MTPFFLLLYLPAGWAAACNGAAKPKPLVAAVWKEVGSAGGREVVIRPDADKLKALGLTAEQLRKAVRGRRFAPGKPWIVELADGKAIDLASVATLTVRELVAPPFTVKLSDGRKVLVTPDPKKIARYVVTGRDFEFDVRRQLADWSGDDPGKVHVLAGLPIPGNVGPHLTERDTMRHVSVGEPLAAFAKVEVRSKPRP